MPTRNPRINITFEQAVVCLLAELAKQEQKSVSSLAKELILEALDRREDTALSAIANIRDHENAKKTKHQDVWE